jgi:hypothetical protein
VREVVEYYTARETDVYITLLDASKAFDRMEFTALFKILISKGICPLVAASFYACTPNRASGCDGGTLQPRVSK